MKFSIITPTFNSAAVIGNCVLTIINQSFTDFEHIIIDNLSRDGTLDIIREMYEQAGFGDKLQVFSERDSGIADAFNRGIRKARGEYVLILNSDDAFYRPDTLARINEALKRGNYPVVHGDMYFEDDVYGSNLRRPMLCPIYQAFPYNHPGMFIKREVYEEFGEYDTTYKVAMDYEFLLRLELRYPDFRNRILYFNEFPLTISKAGGASWNNEMQGIRDIRRALKAAGQYSIKARYHFAARASRVFIKKILHFAGLDQIIRMWRDHKWGNA